MGRPGRGESQIRDRARPEARLRRCAPRSTHSRTNDGLGVDKVRWFVGTGDDRTRRRSVSSLPAELSRDAAAASGVDEGSALDRRPAPMVLTTVCVLRSSPRRSADRTVPVGVRWRRTAGSVGCCAGTFPVVRGHPALERSALVTLSAAGVARDCWQCQRRAVRVESDVTGSCAAARDHERCRATLCGCAPRRDVRSRQAKGRTLEHALRCRQRPSVRSAARSERTIA